MKLFSRSKESSDPADIIHNSFIAVADKIYDALEEEGYHWRKPWGVKRFESLVLTKFMMDYSFSGLSEDKLNDDEKNPIENAVEQLKQANGGSDIEAIKTAIDNLNKSWEPIAQKMYQAAQQEAQTPPNGADANADVNESSEGSTEEGDVEDADFEVVEEEK